MPSPASTSSVRPGEVAGVLRLLAFIILAVALMVLDHRGGWLHATRARAEALVQPLWWLAGQPARIGTALSENATTRVQLARDNERLRHELLLASARYARLRTAAAENDRLRGLLDTAQRRRLDVQLAAVIDIDQDPTRQRLLLDLGSSSGVHSGQTVIDAGGLMGQVIATTATTATVLLLTDPDHAVPVLVARSGVRLVVYGVGRSNELKVGDVPRSADVRVGDELLTSGLGGRFPPGLAVGRIGALHVGEAHAFLEGDVIPAAQFDRGLDVLLLRGYRAPESPPVATVAGVPATATASGQQGRTP
ncbi:MAG: rod shape-determining protein MreC [Thermomonas sp.]|uniref:rod shape-determining protein MreC n=1 Tax=Thermomonas sp. TaxID=1971895 RepID=UPI0031BACD80|nr:rod shape-determining protein MreC [Thermomonas sp.]